MPPQRRLPPLLGLALLGLALAAALGAECEGPPVVPAGFLGSIPTLLFTQNTAVFILPDGSRLETCLSALPAGVAMNSSAATNISSNSSSSSTFAAMAGIPAVGCVTAVLSPPLATVGFTPFGPAGTPNCGPSALTQVVSFDAALFAPALAGSLPCPVGNAGPGVAGGASTSLPPALWLPTPAVAASVSFPATPLLELPQQQGADASVGVAPTGLFLSFGGVRVDYCAGKVTPLPITGTDVAVEVITAAAAVGSSPPLCYWLRRTGVGGSTLQYRFALSPQTGTATTGAARCPTSWGGPADDDDGSGAGNNGSGDDDGDAFALSLVTIPAAYAPFPSPSPQPSPSPAFSISLVLPRVLSNVAATPVVIGGVGFAALGLGGAPSTLSVTFLRPAVAGARATRWACGSLFVLNDTAMSCTVPPGGGGGALQLQLRDASSTGGDRVAVWPDDAAVTATLLEFAAPRHAGAPPPPTALSFAPPVITALAATGSPPSSGGGGSASLVRVAPAPALPPSPQITGLVPGDGAGLTLVSGDVLSIFGTGFGGRDAGSTLAPSMPNASDGQGLCVFLSWDVYTDAGAAAAAASSSAADAALSAPMWLRANLSCDGALGHPGEGELPWCRLLSWSDTRVDVIVPPGIGGGNRLLTVMRAGMPSASVRLSYASAALSSAAGVAASGGAGRSSTPALLGTRGGDQLRLIGRNLGRGQVLLASSAGTSSAARRVWAAPGAAAAAPTSPPQPPGVGVGTLPFYYGGGGAGAGAAPAAPVAWPTAGLRVTPREPGGWLASGGIAALSPPAVLAAAISAVGACAASEAAWGSFDPTMLIVESPWGCVADLPPWSAGVGGSLPLHALPPLPGSGTASPAATPASSSGPASPAGSRLCAGGALPPMLTTPSPPSSVDASAAPMYSAWEAVVSSGAGVVGASARSVAAPPGAGAAVPIALRIVPAWGVGQRIPPSSGSGSPSASPSPTAPYVRVVYAPPAVTSLAPSVLLTNGSHGSAMGAATLHVLGANLAHGGRGVSAWPEWAGSSGSAAAPAPAPHPSTVHALLSAGGVNFSSIAVLSGGASPLVITVGGLPCAASAVSVTASSSGGDSAQVFQYGGDVGSSLSCTGLPPDLPLGSAHIAVSRNGQQSASAPQQGQQGVGVVALTVGCAEGTFGLPGRDPACAPCPPDAVCVGFRNGLHNPPAALPGFFDIGPALGWVAAGGTQQQFTPSTCPSGVVSSPGVCIVRCSPTDACIGGNVCGAGYAGELLTPPPPQPPGAPSNGGTPSPIPTRIGICAPVGGDTALGGGGVNTRDAPPAGGPLSFAVSVGLGVGISLLVLTASIAAFFIVTSPARRAAFGSAARKLQFRGSGRRGWDSAGAGAGGGGGPGEEMAWWSWGRGKGRGAWGSPGATAAGISGGGVSYQTRGGSRFASGSAGPGSGGGGAVIMNPAHPRGRGGNNTSSLSSSGSTSQGSSSSSSLAVAGLGGVLASGSSASGQGLGDGAVSIHGGSQFLLGGGGGSGIGWGSERAFEGGSTLPHQHHHGQQQQQGGGGVFPRGTRSAAVSAAGSSSGGGADGVHLVPRPQPKLASAYSPAAAAALAAQLSPPSSASLSSSSFALVSSGGARPFRFDQARSRSPSPPQSFQPLQVQQPHQPLQHTGGGDISEFNAAARLRASAAGASPTPPFASSSRGRHMSNIVAQQGQPHHHRRGGSTARGGPRTRLQHQQSGPSSSSSSSWAQGPQTRSVSAGLHRGGAQAQAGGGTRSAFNPVMVATGSNGKHILLGPVDRHAAFVRPAAGSATPRGVVAV